MVHHPLGTRATGLAATGLAACLIAASPPAQAQTATPPSAITTAPATPSTTPASSTPAPTGSDQPAPYSGLVIDGIKLSAQLDAGFIMNPYRPSTGQNWGQLFTDHANQAQLNQLLLTAQKPLDPKNSDFQLGFKLQFMYGSDARYTQYLGVLNRVNPDDRYQLDVVEANVQAHLPLISAGGFDLKAGMYSTPLGYETIDPSNNPFYSHSYIFQYGLPLKHLGMLATAHLTDKIDLYGGVDTGTNTTVGILGDNNGAIGGIGGIGLNLGNTTVLALTHFGPDDSTRVFSPVGVNANGAWRTFSDVVVTWKATDKTTVVAEANWVRESCFNPPACQTANGYGAAGYVSYALTDTVALNARAEGWRDDNNFFVAQFPGNADFVRFQQGLSTPYVHFAPPGLTTPAGGTTYGALTFGATWKPSLPPPVVGLMIRPEIRWDHAFSDNNPFNNNYQTVGSKGTKNSFTFGADAVLSF